MTDQVASEGASSYLIQTKPKQEFRALQQLQNQRYKCFLPTLQVERIYRGNAKTVTESMFYRYLFIQLNTVSSDWAAIRSTSGVSNLVAFGGRYATISETMIEIIRSVQSVAPRPVF